MSFPDLPPVVVDVGTAYTKMGYACNSRPDYIIPTIVGRRRISGR
jgi:actin-related protein 3